MICMSCSSRQENRQTESDKTIVAENDSISVSYQVVDSAKGEFDIPTAAIWISNKNSGQEKKLYQTVQSYSYSWYIADANRFLSVPLDSIPVASAVTIYNDDPLQLIVEGCPDMRNIFSYFIDVANRKAWYVPANGGYLGTTSEEGYMIFQSYRYVSDPDIAGRYTFLQIFDEAGNMVDSLDLEHLHLQRKLE